MVRTHETSIAWKSGFLAVMVHVVLLGALIFSFNWKAAHTVVVVSEVELWNDLPNIKQSPLTKPKPKVVEPKVEEPKVEEPKVEEAKPEVDIALEKKKKEDEIKKKEEAERNKKIAELQKKLLEDLDPNKKTLEKLQAEMRGENTKPTAAINQGLVDEYIGKITAKVRGHVNRGLCGDGELELVFKVNLLPTGEFVSNPKLIKSSGNAACDGAVERAIIASEPFPLPSDPDALAEFRNLNLKFRPND